MSPTPEQRARLDIDSALEAAVWLIQDRATMNLSAAPGVAVREFRMASGHGFADYLLFVNGKAVGVLEAKPAGYALTNVELQADKYASGLPAGLNPPVNPLPFLYLSTGVETRFINGLDPDPKTRAISANLPHIHRPATLAEWIDRETLDAWVKRLHAEGPDRDRHQPGTLLHAQPPASADPDGDGIGQDDRGNLGLACEPHTTIMIVSTTRNTEVLRLSRNPTSRAPVAPLGVAAMLPMTQ